MNNDKINVLVVEPGKKPYAKEISSELASLQHEVGGYIQAVYPYEEPVAIVCDEEAKLTGKELNAHTNESYGDGRQGGFFVSNPFKHHTGRYTHKGISNKIGKETQV